MTEITGSTEVVIRELEQGTRGVTIELDNDKVHWWEMVRSGDGSRDFLLD